MKQRPGTIGAGWTITQNYVYRDVNGTPNNKNDDGFKLLLNGGSYDLVYDLVDNFFHTKTETFMRVQNFSGGQNTYGLFWVATTKDGTQFRFGYNSDSELASNSGKSYALRWNLDQVNDTHNNKIFYSYLEDPYQGDKGTVYLSNITYNSDQKREIEFVYENSVRPDIRFVFDQGNMLNETRRLSEIKISANDNLVRKYVLEYSNLNPEQSLSSLSKIKFVGSDNSSQLHQVSFEYYSASNGFANRTDIWIPPTTFTDLTLDFGVRFVDFNNDGFVDILHARESTGEKYAYLNNKSGGWTNVTSSWVLPEYFTQTDNVDKGVRFVDFNNDGFVDILQGNSYFGGLKRAWQNNKTGGWTEVSSTWAPPIYFVQSGTDNGVQLVDLNGDGRIDLLQSNNDIKTAYINNGTGWTDVSSTWIAPTIFTNSGSDTGARIEDVNGDGLPDIINASSGIESPILRAWLNNGTGWIDYSSVWAPPAYFVGTSSDDRGFRMADLNGDGLIDITQDATNSTSSEKDTWLNNGNGWTLNSFWQSPEPFTYNGKNIGRRLADINGDGFGDILVAYTDGYGPHLYTWVKNSTTPFMLKKITNEFGGMTSVSYQESTIMNNNGTDNLSGLGFNTWVVRNVSQNNSMNSQFNSVGSYFYNYSGGKYDTNDLEFRGFSQVNETRPDNSTAIHYFHQDSARKGKEFKTEIYDSGGRIFAKSENVFNYTNQSAGYFKVVLSAQTSYLYDGSTSNPKTTNISYSYDSYGNPTQKIMFGDVNVSGDEKFEFYSYVYNASAWIFDRLSKYQLFASDNSTKVKETKYYYDYRPHGVGPTVGDVTEIDNWLDTGGIQKIKYSYDWHGNVIKETDPRGFVNTYDYGTRDTTFTYPDWNDNALSHRNDFAYDLGTGNVLWQFSNNINRSFAYDVFGRILKEIEPYDSEELPTKNYSYNFNGISPEQIKVSQRTSANKTYDVYYFYDGFANFIQLKRPTEGSQQIVKNIFYDSLGRVSSEQNPYFDSFSASLSTPSTISSRTNYTYDALSRVIRVTNPDSTNITIDFNQRNITAYDENGHRKAYVLDGYDRIISVLEYNNDPVLKYDFETDIYNTSYEYDTSDNLVKITDALENIFSFGYDSLGRRISLRDPDLGNWTYEYDLAGNLIRQTQNGGGNLITGDGYYREYDELNQLVRIRNGSSANSPIIENYTYDPFGQRIKIARNDSANTTIYTPFRDFMRIVNSSGTYDFTYVYQDRVLVARINPDGSKWFYHPDHLGSTSLITDQNGNIVENTFYSPFGELLGGGKSENKLYTGQFADITDQYYYGARYYKPGTGQFAQPDTLIQKVYNPQNLNRYSYVFNNPYKYNDPNGREPTKPQIDSTDTIVDAIKTIENQNPNLSPSGVLDKIVTGQNILSNRGNFPESARYAYTTQVGFVDNLHFFANAKYSKIYGSTLLSLLDTPVEIAQYSGLLGKQQQSGFSYEDVRSNRLGRDFASQLSNNVPLSQQYSSFINKLGGSKNPPVDIEKQYSGLWSKIPDKENIGQHLPSNKICIQCNGPALPYSQELPKPTGFDYLIQTISNFFGESK